MRIRYPAEVKAPEVLMPRVANELYAHGMITGESRFLAEERGLAGARDFAKPAPDLPTAATSSPSENAAAKKIETRDGIPYATQEAELRIDTENPRRRRGNPTSGIARSAWDDEPSKGTGWNDRTPFHSDVCRRPGRHIEVRKPGLRCANAFDRGGHRCRTSAFDDGLLPSTMRAYIDKKHAVLHIPAGVPLNAVLQTLGSEVKLPNSANVSKPVVAPTITRRRSNRTSSKSWCTGLRSRRRRRW